MRALNRRFRKAQGPFAPKKKDVPLNTLIATVLSQNTSDLNSDRAYASLRSRFRSWDEVLHAPTEEVAESIRSGGIADVKAGRIQTILGEIERRERRLSLASLKRMSDQEATEYLLSLPGVGPKTAACVLLFSMERPAFPVDTHVHRVTTRLGLVPAKSTAEQGHALLTPVIPPEIRYEFHIQLVTHGRQICRPRIPLCTTCPVFDLCESGPRLLAKGLAR